MFWRQNFKGFCEVKDQLQPDTSMYEFFDKRAIENEFLTKKIFPKILWEKGQVQISNKRRSLRWK